MATAQCGFGANSSGEQAHPREIGRLRVERAYGRLSLGYEESHRSEDNIGRPMFQVNAETPPGVPRRGRQGAGKNIVQKSPRVHAHCRRTDGCQFRCSGEKFAPTHVILRPLRAKILQPFTRGDLPPVAKIGCMLDLAQSSKPR
jgi:hypothetical protein